MDQDTLERYNLVLRDAFDYIEKKKPVSKRKQWSPDQREKWMLRVPKCPVCSEVWSKSNIMTKEHIHPIVLGGNDRDDNHVPLCKKCNNARNDVMVAVLGSSNILAIRNRMPALRNSITEFVIWCHATISNDQKALLETSHLTKSFCKLRGISDPFDDGTFEPKTQKKAGMKSLLSRGLKFGASILSNQNKRNHSSMDVDYNIAVTCKNQNCKLELKIPEGHSGQYRCPVCSLEQSINLNEKQSQTKTILGPNSVKNSANSKPKNNQYPLIKNLNSSQGGFKLPREPKDFVKSVIWYVDNASNYETLHSFSNAFKSTDIVPRSRANNTIIRITQGINKEGRFELLSEGELNLDIEVIIDKTLETMMNRGLNFKNTDNEDLFKSQVEEYFARAREIAIDLPASLHGVNDSTEILENIMSRKFPMKTWMDDNWEGEESYSLLRQKIIEFESKNTLPRKYRDVLKEDFQLPKRWSVKQVMKELDKLHTQRKSDKPNKVNINSKKLDVDIQGEKLVHDITIFVTDSIMNRISAKSYQSGFSSPQLAYIFKLAKEKFKLSWNELFSPFEVTGTIEQKSLQVLMKIGFLSQEEINSDDVLKYRITTGDTGSIEVKFPLVEWLQTEWEGKSSYPLLREAITKYESSKSEPRKFRDVIKQDFGIAKSWNVKQIIKKMNEIKLSSEKK